MAKYYENSFFSSDIFKYGEQFQIKKDDIITMELDLTKDKGVLSFVFDSEFKRGITKLDESITNVFYDEIDVNRNWRAAVSFSGTNSVSIVS